MKRPEITLELFVFRLLQERGERVHVIEEVRPVWVLAGANVGYERPHCAKIASMNQTTRYGVLALIAVLVIAGGAYYLHTSTVSAPTAGTPQSQTKAFVLVVKARTLISGQPVLSVKQGDTVSITITADESDELHLHGYDKQVDFATGTPATLTFVADQSGRFPFEMEGSKTDLGEVDVQP